MGFAPVAYTLRQEFLRYDPADPSWRNRGRFEKLLSAMRKGFGGHVEPPGGHS